MCGESDTQHSLLFLAESCFCFSMLDANIWYFQDGRVTNSLQEIYKLYNLEYKYASLALVRLETVYECWQEAVTQIGHHMLCF